MYVERRLLKLLPWRRALLHLTGCVVLIFVSITIPVQGAIAAVAVPLGTWQMGEKVAIQIFDCSGMLCGRVVWLRAPIDQLGLLKRDKLNPNPALRLRQVCGATIVWNLHSTDPNRWELGWFYNPNDGMTYRATIELESGDILVARIYLGHPIFGVTRTLIRVLKGTSDGWC